MVFYSRDPERTGLSAVLQSSEPDYQYLRTEWNEIRSKIIEPIFKDDNGDGNVSELSVGTTPPNNSEFNSKERKKDDPYGRVKWFMESRFGSEASPSEPQLVAYADAARVMKQSMIEAVEDIEIEALLDIEAAPNAYKNNWIPLGPTVIDHGQASKYPQVSGRVTSIAVGPSGKRIYVGTSNGGVWYSGDEGNTWTPLNEWATSWQVSVEADSLSVGSIAVVFDKTNRDKDVIYVGTGEPLAELKRQKWKNSAIQFLGIGIKRSVNGGKTWTTEAKNLKANNSSIYKIVIDPDNSAKAFVASSTGIYKRPASTDPKILVKWDLITSPNFIDSSGIINPNGTVSDFIITGSGATKKYYAAFWDSQVFQSTNSTSWNALAGVNSISRKVLAACEKKPEVVYLFDQNNDLFQLSGNSFVMVDRTTLPVVFVGGQGDYDIILAVDPENENEVYLGGDIVYESDGATPPDFNWSLSLYKGQVSTVAGKLIFSFLPANKLTGDMYSSISQTADNTFIGSNIHPDVHAIAFALDATGLKHDRTKVWIGCDGGIFYSTQAGMKGTFNAKNYGLAITQTTYISQHPDISSIIFAGTQDNGTLRYLGSENWYEVQQGDGGGVAVDTANPRKIMHEYFSGNLWTCSDGGSNNCSWRNVLNPTTERTRFFSQIAVAPTGNPSMVAFGTDRLRLSANWGTNWIVLPTKADPAVGLPLISQQIIGPITTVKIASATQIFAATESDVFRYQRVGTDWVKQTIPNIGLPAGTFYITYIEVDPSNVNNFYVALGGPGSFVRCYYCDTSGATIWVAVGTPKDKLNVPCHTIVIDPANPLEAYLGSDVGVWKREKDPANPGKLRWIPFSYGLPESAVMDLKIHEKARLLRVSTHGRGVWEIPLDFPGIPTGTRKSKKIDLYLKGTKLDNRREDPTGVYPLSLSAPDPDNLWIPSFLDSPSIWIESRRSFNFIMVRVNNRGFQAVSFSDVLVILLIADGAGAMPDLPVDLLKQIRAKDIKMDWSKSKWKLVGRNKPKTNITSLLPQNVEFPADFSLLPGSTYAWAVAIVTTVSNDDPFAGTEPVVLKLIATNKQVACKKVRVI